MCRVSWLFLGQSKQINDKFAGEFMRAVCSTVDPNFYVEVNVEIEVLKQLPALSAASKERLYCARA